MIMPCYVSGKRYRPNRDPTTIAHCARFSAVVKLTNSLPGRLLLCVA